MNETPIEPRAYRICQEDTQKGYNDISKALDRVSEFLNSSDDLMYILRDHFASETQAILILHDDFEEHMEYEYDIIRASFSEEQFNFLLGNDYIEALYNPLEEFYLELAENGIDLNSMLINYPREQFIETLERARAYLNTHGATIVYKEIQIVESLEFINKCMEHQEVIVSMERFYRANIKSRREPQRKTPVRTN